MDTITPASAIVVAFLIFIVTTVILGLQKRQESGQWRQIDSDHYLDPQTSQIVRIHRP